MRGSWSDIILRLMCGFPAYGARSDRAVDGEEGADAEIGQGDGAIALEYAHVLRLHESLAVSLSLSSPLLWMCTFDVVPHR